MAFCLPFSTALTLLFSAFGLLLAFIGFDWSSFKQAIRHPISILCVGLFLWLALSMLWSIAPSDELMEGISKYRKLLYVPIVAMLLISTRVKPWFLMNFFVIGCLVVCFGSLSSSSGLLEHLIGPQLPGGGWGLGGNAAKHWFYIGPPEAPTFGRAWIAQGAFLVFSVTYLLGVTVASFMEVKAPLGRWRRFALIGAIALLTYVVLNLGGRTGYLLLILGIAFWAGLFWSKNMRFALVCSLIGFSFLLGAHSLAKPRVLDRVTNAVNDVVEYQESGALTSQGLRLRFWAVGVNAGLEKPLTGWGVGSYAEVFSRDSEQPEDLRNSRPHPHSEWILQFVQGGLLASFLLVGLVLTGLRIFSRLRLAEGSHTAMVSLGLLGSMFLFLIDGSFNSVLWDLGEGHAFILLTASVISLRLK